MKRIKKENRGGARKGFGRKSDPWLKALIRKRKQKRTIPYKLDSLQNVIKMAS